MNGEIGAAPPRAAGRTRQHRARTRGGVSEAGPTAIEASQSVGDAAFAILRRHFGAFRAHEEGTRLGKDPEELHQMRVASRRLRAAMALFRDALPPRATRLRKELAWIGAFLGHVRDVDVQIEQAKAWASEAPQRSRATFQPLLAVLEDQRRQARVPLLRALHSPRYARFLAAYTAFLRPGPAGRVAAARHPVLALAPDLIGKRYRSVRKAGDRLTDASPPAKYHALRIKCKRLRYAVEFFADLYGKPAEDLAKRAARLQDALGRQQDARIAIQRLHRLCRTQGRRLPPETLFAMGQAAQRYAHQTLEARAAFPEAYREITGKRWKRLRDAMEALRPEASPRRR